ncbi:MAG: anaerobic ribonucleoside-triphosphate reductase, partial [Candidatus Cryptobacteroides sp.]
YYDKNYWHALFDEFAFPDGTKPVWERVDFLQRFFLKWFNNERTKTLLTFPVETMALLTDGKDVLDQDYKALTCEMYAEGHSFFTYLSDNPNALASCCRLRNEINENTFSFTNGLTGVQTGSANVITLNLNRITQNWARENGFTRSYLKEHFFENTDSFKTYFIGILERVYTYHIAYKTLLYETEQAGMLTASNAGYIKMNKLYSTIGENGINEAAEFLGMKCSYNPQYRDFCRLVTGTISEQNKLHSKDRKFLFNQEFVPAEGLSSKNLNWDKEDGYWIPEGRILYNSYFYLANDTDTDVLDKFRLHGREFTELLDGGVGLHCNLEEHLSKEQYSKLVDFAIANGTSYFTFNVPNSECTNLNCHHIVKKPMDKCPVCGAPMRQWTRVIGFLRPVENFDKYRHAEAKQRYYAKEVK